MLARIGREISVNLTKLGAKVFALDKSQEKLDDIIREYPGVYPVCQDLRNWDETKNIVQGLGELDGLVNNAVLAFNLHKAVDVLKEHLNACLDPRGGGGTLFFPHTQARTQHLPFTQKNIWNFKHPQKNI